MPKSHSNPLRGRAKAFQAARQRINHRCREACRLDPGTVFVNGAFQRSFKYERVVLQYKDENFNTGRVYHCRVHPDGRRERIGQPRYR